MSAPENTAHGSLCAYDSDSKIIWACPAPDSMCWGDAEDCHGENSTTAASNQLGCPNGSPTTWCCDLQAENCTETAGQINICWVKGVVNPNAGVPPAAVLSIAASSLAAISSSAIASRLSALATVIFKPTSTSTTTTPNMASALATSTPLPLLLDSGSLSGGAIAGVVIGAIAGFVLIALAAFFVYVYCRKTGKIGAGQPTKYQQQGYYGPPIQRYEAPAAHHQPLVEAGAEEVVHEMSSQTAHIAHK